MTLTLNRHSNQLIDHTEQWKRTHAAFCNGNAAAWWRAVQRQFTVCFPALRRSARGSATICRRLNIVNINHQLLFHTCQRPNLHDGGDLAAALETDRIAGVAVQTMSCANDGLCKRWAVQTMGGAQGLAGVLNIQLGSGVHHCFQANLAKPSNARFYLWETSGFHPASL